jgi:hypothetical protein
LNKDLENFIRKNQTEILEIKVPIVKQKHHESLPQQTRTSGRQSHRAQRYIEIKEKNRRNHSQTTQEL